MTVHVGNQEIIHKYQADKCILNRLNYIINIRWRLIAQIDDRESNWRSRNW